MPKQGVRIHIQKLINEAPPLTEDKRHRLQTIFHPATARGFVVPAGTETAPATN